MANDEVLREQLIQMLRGGHAHATFDDAVRDFPVDRAGIRPAGAPYSGWELLEHMRLAQNDILRFSQSADWVSPEFPAGYWPKSPAPHAPASGTTRWMPSTPTWPSSREWSAIRRRTCIGSSPGATARHFCARPC